MNKSIWLSILSIFAVVALVGGLTLAYFSDVGTSSANTFSTGTLDLRLTDTDQSVVDSVSASFGGTLVPGGACTGAQTLSLRNSGTVAANHAEVHLGNVVTDTGDAADPDIDSFLKIQTLTYDGDNVLGQITDNNSNGFRDLNDWAASATALDSLGLTNLNGDHPLII